MHKAIIFSILSLLSLSALAQSGNTPAENAKKENSFKFFNTKKHPEYFSDCASVTMADGSTKAIADVKIGENVKTCRNGKSVVTQVKQVAVYDSPSSSLTAVYLRPAYESAADKSKLTPALLLEATPHHLVQTNKGRKRMKELSKNDILYHFEPETGVVSTWKVGVIQANARKVSKAYNLETEEGTYLVSNMIMAQ